MRWVYCHGRLLHTTRKWQNTDSGCLQQILHVCSPLQACLSWSLGIDYGWWWLSLCKDSTGCLTKGLKVGNMQTPLGWKMGRATSACKFNIFIWNNLVVSKVIIMLERVKKKSSNKIIVWTGIDQGKMHYPHSVLNAIPDFASNNSGSLGWSMDKLFMQVSEDICSYDRTITNLTFKNTYHSNFTFCSSLLKIIQKNLENDSN